MRSQRSHLTDFSEVQSAIDNSNKSFILNENIEIKSYGAIYMNDNGKSFQLVNDKTLTKGKKVVEMHFQKTLFKKG